MSYVVLARKYRPKKFAEMVGQEHVVQALGNALRTQRLHHAYLFTGTRGVGKTTVSRILAKSLNCTGPDGQGGITAEPCGVCEACRDIDAGRFVDYTELDAASNRGVDEVQSLLEQAVYKPVQGRFKVFMIDEVHMLTNTAFNAMLKTLEEPPEYLKFVLATTDPQKVPVTVLSRCLQFNLRPMAPETVHEHLQRVLETEGVAGESGALALLARAARGSMRDALSLTDQAIAFGGGQLQEAAVRQMLGAVDRHHVWTLLEALATNDGARVVSTVEDMRINGFGAASVLEELVGILQRVAVLQLAPGATGPATEGERLVALAEALPPDETQLLYSLCLHGRTELGLAPDEYAALNMVLLRLLAFRLPSAEKKTLKNPAPQVEASPPAAVTDGASPAVPDAATALARAATPAVQTAPVEQGNVNSATSQAAEVKYWGDDADDCEPVPGVTASAALPAPVQAPVQAPVPAPAPALAPEREPEPRPVPVAMPMPASVTGTPTAGTVAALDGAATLGDLWFGIVQALLRAEAVTALVRELALQSCLIKQDGSTWTLAIPGSALMHNASRERLQAALAEHGHPVRLELQVGPVDDSPARRLAAAAQARLKAAEASLLADDFVQTMMRDFGGKIVPGSLQAL